MEQFSSFQLLLIFQTRFHWMNRSINRKTHLKERSLIGIPSQERLVPVSQRCKTSQESWLWSFLLHSPEEEGGDEGTSWSDLASPRGGQRGHRSSVRLQVCECVQTGPLRCWVDVCGLFLLRCWHCVGSEEEEERVRTGPAKTGRWRWRSRRAGRWRRCCRCCFLFLSHASFLSVHVSTGAEWRAAVGFQHFLSTHLDANQPEWQLQGGSGLVWRSVFVKAAQTFSLQIFSLRYLPTHKQWQTVLKINLQLKIILVRPLINYNEKVSDSII